MRTEEDEADYWKSAVVTAQEFAFPATPRRCEQCQHGLKTGVCRVRDHAVQERRLRVDHLIPLSLGGSNSIRNLWPQSTKRSPWNSFVKDALERKLHKLVCAGQLDLKTAQNEIASDWIEAYKKYVGTRPPAPTVHETKTESETTGNEVWVNTHSSKILENWFAVLR